MYPWLYFERCRNTDTRGSFHIKSDSQKHHVLNRENHQHGIFINNFWDKKMLFFSFLEIHQYIIFCTWNDHFEAQNDNLLAIWPFFDHQNRPVMFLEKWKKRFFLVSKIIYKNTMLMIFPVKNMVFLTVWLDMKWPINLIYLTQRILKKVNFLRLFGLHCKKNAGLNTF